MAEVETITFDITVLHIAVVKKSLLLVSDSGQYNCQSRGT